MICDARHNVMGDTSIQVDGDGEKKKKRGRGRDSGRNYCLGACVVSTIDEQGKECCTIALIAIG